MSSIWNDLDSEVKTDPGLMAGYVPEEEIKEAQKQLNLNFDNSYTKFILHYGGGIVGSHFIYGLKKQSNMGNTLTSVLTATKFYKEEQEWPDIEDWYIVSDDGKGNPIGIDPQGIVWLSDHDAGFEKVKLAVNFEEFLYKLHTDTLYD